MIDTNHEVPLRYRITEISLLSLHQIFPKSHLLQSLREKIRYRLYCRLENIRKLQNRRGKIHTIDSYEDLSEQDFKNRYLKHGIPVVFKGAAKNWECTQKWDFNFLEENYAKDEYTIVGTEGFLTEEEKATYKISQNESAGKVSLEQFIRDQRAGKPSNLRFCPLLEVHPELQDDLNKNWLLKRSICNLGYGFQAFISGKGKVSKTHNAMTAFHFIQAEGKKKWTFYPQAYFPLLKLAPERKGYFFSKIEPKHLEDLSSDYDLLDCYQVILEEGDVLYGPTWMWHHVENLEDSIGISYRFTHLGGALKFSFGMTFLRVFLAKPNFLQILFDSFFGKKVTERDRNLKQPKMYFD